MARKVYVGVGLPQGYTQVEYIQADGSQYIDTGIKGSDALKVSCAFIPNDDAYANLAVFGSTWGHNGFMLNTLPEGIAFLTKGVQATAAANVGGLNVVECTKDRFIANGIAYSLNGTASNTTNNIYMFWVGGEQYPDNRGKAKMLWFKMYEGDVIVRDYVPCINPDNVAGMYDLVSGTFFPNIGTGQFVTGGVNNGVARSVKRMDVGVEKVPIFDLPEGYAQVEFIESNGGQWIDTNFIPTANTRIESDFEYTDLATGYDGVYVSSSWAMFGLNGKHEVYIGSKYVIGETATKERITIVLDIPGKKTNIGRKEYAFSSDMTYSKGSVSLPIFAYRNDNGIVGYCKKKQYVYKVYDNGVAVRYYIPCVKASGEAGLYDVIEGKFYANAGSGSFVAGASIESAVSVARFVKKGYIGINGVARPFWGENKKIAYYGKITSLVGQRGEVGAAGIPANSGANSGGHAVFAGGLSGMALSAAVDAYDETLAKQTPTALGASRWASTGGTVANTAVFAGGSRGTSSVSPATNVDFYDPDLARGTGVISEARYYIMFAKAGENGVFGGGIKKNPSTGYGMSSATVDIFSGTLTRFTGTSLAEAKHLKGSASVGGCAIFDGAVVDAYDESATHSTLSIVGFSSDVAAGSGKIAVFASGTDANKVFALDEFMTVTTAPALSLARNYMGAIGYGGFMIFAGGRDSSSKLIDLVDVYDESLTKYEVESMSEAMTGLVAAPVGDFVLLSGGSGSAGYIGATHAYTVK